MLRCGMKKHGPNGLPLGSGLYWNKETIYVELWHGGEKLGQFSSKTADVQKALRFKDAKLKELIKAEEAAIADLKRGVRVAELFDDYIGRLKRRESDSGSYSEGRSYDTQSYRATSRINKHLVPSFGK